MRSFLFLMFLLSPILSCSLFPSPGGPTEAALQAGQAQIAASLDTNGDGIVSADELKSGATESFLAGNWEYLAWIASLLLTGEGSRRLGKAQQKKNGAT